MEELLPLLAEAGAELKPILDVLKDLGGAFSGLSGGLNFATAATGLLSQGISAAAQAITGPFQQLGSAITPFVQALNPSLVMVFNQAMRSLQATIGVALVPVMEALIGAVREVAGILLPAMQALAPVMGNLAKTVLTLFMPPFRILADMLTELAPILEFLTGVLKVVADAWTTLQVVARTLYQTLFKFISGLLGGEGNLKDVLKSFRDAMHQVVESVLKLVAYLAKAFSQFDFIAAMSKNLREMAAPAKPGAAPAPQDVGFKGFEDIVKTMAVSAFAAMGGGGAEDQSEKEWLKHLADTLDGVAKDGQTFQGYLNELFKDLENKLGKWFADLPAWIADAINPLGATARGVRQGMRQAGGAERAADRLGGRPGLRGGH